MNSTSRLLCLLCVVLLAGCGGSADLTGHWIQVSGTRPESELTLNGDGTGRFLPRGGVAYQIETWEAAGDYLTLNIPGAKVIARFSLNDDLQLSRVDEFEEFNGRYRRQ